ncbi:cation:proton antiporter [Nocardia stercoris]|uniref:cation:proton antiporter n=1 Tax=Nocardia stercoris TaxID=2483361 RepID=UPI001F186228|nr:cation:proton antiporter [Nocardia stercoris]
MNVYPSLPDVSTHFFLQMAAILVAYRLLWSVFRRMGQVEVVAIMAAGFLLGPSVLGAAWPAAQNWLFPATLRIADAAVPHPTLTVLYAVGQLGLVLYMFLVGTSFDTSIFTSHLRTAGITATTGVVVPMLLGGATGLVLAVRGGYFTGKVTPWEAALFLAAAVAVTSFPVLAWIIQDSGLGRTRLGTMALSCAAIDDACAWILLAVVIAFARHNPADAILALAGGVGFTLVMILIARPVLRRLDYWDRPEALVGGLPIGPFVVILVLGLVSAWFTDFVGASSVFGAFLAGVVVPRDRFVDMMRTRLEPLVSYLLLPAYFVFSGLNTRLSLVFEPSVLVVALVVLVVSFGGKFGAITLAARANGMNWREASSIGALANARGLMELVLVNIGLTQGIITPALYTILTVMALVTTFTATPAFRFIEARARKREPGSIAVSGKPAPESDPAANRSPTAGARATEHLEGVGVQPDRVRGQRAADRHRPVRVLDVTGPDQRGAPVVRADSRPPVRRPDGGPGQGALRRHLDGRASG